MRHGRHRSLAVAAAIVLALSGCATLGIKDSEPADKKAETSQADPGRTEKTAENIVRQPAVDVGLMKQNPPAELRDAQRAPYSLAGLQSCTSLKQEIGRLEHVLGPDVDAIDAQGDPLPERLAAAGAQSIVNAFIPFRSLVREATGAAEADRKFQVMVAAGMARRGFLKGVAKQRGCKI